MLTFRVTKYDPGFRDSAGAYICDDWTSRSDIGRVFNGVVLTQEEYSRVENAYVEVALTYLREAGVGALRIDALESRAGAECAYVEGDIVPLAQAGEVVRAMLREEYWCRLMSPRGFIHVGHDYYMYLGVARISSKAAALARRKGLFVEEFESPYTHVEVSDGEHG